MNISNPPGGNQPPNYTADIGNAQEVTMTTSGGLGEAETAGVQMNIVPKQGGNSMSGLFAASGFSKDMQSDNLHPGVAGARRWRPEPDLSRLRRQRRGRRPDRQGQALVLHERPPAGVAPQHPERLLQQERRQPGDVLLRPGLQQAGVLRSHWENYTPRITWQASQKEQVQLLVGRAAGVPHLLGHGAFQRLAGPSTTAPDADGHGEFSPQRVQTARWTNPVTSRLLLEAGLGNTYYQWGVRELDPNPGRDLVRITDNATILNAAGVIGTMTYRSQNWLVNKTDGANWFFTARTSPARTA